MEINRDIINIVNYTKNPVVTDLNTEYDAELRACQALTNSPTLSQYGVVFTLPYRKAKGNLIPDYGGQIFIPNGDASPDEMFYRTSTKNDWGSWIKVSGIVSQGTNTYGSYIKYANGLLIQWNYDTVKDQAVNIDYGNAGKVFFGYRDVTFPLAFKNATSYCLTVGLAKWGTGGSWGSWMTNNTGQSARLIFYDFFARPSGENFYYSWLAVGFWK